MIETEDVSATPIKREANNLEYVPALPPPAAVPAVSGLHAGGLRDSDADGEEGV
jgi:hypothetical protein